MAALGASLEEEFAEKYLMVNDKLYLPALEARLQHKYEEEQVSIRDRTASLSAADAKSSIAEMEDYKSWMIDGMDRMERLRVVLIEPYVGKWLPAHGGIKVTLENGEVILKKGAFRRLFAKENDTI